MFNNLIGKNKELGRFLFCERYTLPPVKNAMYIAEGQDLKRGAVVDVNGVLVGTNSLMPYAVLEFDCDTRSGGKESSVFVKGEFNFDKLHFASGLSKSDLDNIVYNGSGLGIVIKPYEYAEGFIPLMVPAGTSQSNPLMTAEETERMIDAMKPIDDMTLRFEFSKKDYNPETAGVGSAGTWTKVDSPTLNVWDWENTNTNWQASFRKAFLDENNEVRVIAAGDTSSVTDVDNMFEGDYENNPNQSTYRLIARNNIVDCVGFDISGAPDESDKVFLATALKYARFDLSRQKQVYAFYCDTLIEEIGDIDFSSSTSLTHIGMLFARCSKMRKVGVIKISPLITNAFGLVDYNRSMEEFGGIVGAGANGIILQGLCQVCNKLKKIENIIDVSNATSSTSVQALFSNCNSIDHVNVTGLSGSTSMYATFSGCYNMKTLPDMDTSIVTDFRYAFYNMYSLERLPDLDVSSATDVSNMFNGCNNVKYGILEMYNKLLARGASITSHTGCFKNCGIDTKEGSAALAQIPQSWGGLAEG